MASYNELLDVLPDVVKIDGFYVDLPCVGRMIHLDGRKWSVRLNPCDDWDKAKFRFPSDVLIGRGGRPHPGIACNVDITGRTVQRKHGTCVVRVKVTFVGDGEPDTVVGGWMPISKME